MIGIGVDTKYLHARGVDIEGVEDVSNIESSGGSSSSSMVSLVAAENISKYDIVTTDGYIANSAIDGQRTKILGMATENITMGNSGNIQTFGDIDNASWSWTANITLFLNGTSVSSIAPSTGFVIPVGTIRNATRVFINIQMPIKL
jgi:hypothetical protein